MVEANKHTFFLSRFNLICAWPWLRVGSAEALHVFIAEIKRRCDAKLTTVESHMSAFCLHTLTIMIDFAHFQRKFLLSKSVFLASPSQLTPSVILCATK